MITTPTLTLRALGDFSLLANGTQASGGPRLRALLTYLALHRDAPQPRAHVAFLLWPDATEAQARNNLRQTLHQLRQTLPEVGRLLLIDARTLQWNPATLCDLDIAAFDAALAEAAAATQHGDQPGVRAALERADRLYVGDLLPDCFDDWIAPERDRLRRLHSQALEDLLRLLETHGETRAAIQCAQRLLALDPLSEDRYRDLMRLYARNQDRASALHVYHTCVSTLQREMGVEPGAATRDAYERMLAEDASTSASPGAASGAASEEGEPANQGSAAQSSPRAPLPVTPALTGREREWERLRDVWLRATQSGPHVALLTGEAGVGKSRLAEEFLLWTGQRGAVTAIARSYATEGQLSLAPVTEWLRSEGLRGPLRRLDTVWLTEVVRLLPELLTERPSLPRYEPMSESGQRLRFFEALARAVLMAPQPIALLLDDMQWLDQETLAWLHLLLRFNPAARLLIVGCARQDELSPQHPLRAFLLQLRAESAVTEIALEPLDAAETLRLASGVAQRELDEVEGLRLFHETGGNPLFVVEMLRADPQRRVARPTGAASPVSASGAAHGEGSADAHSLPPRMYAVLAGRLHQLSPPARAIAEQAATIGRAFTLDLLSAASESGPESAARALDELWQKRIVREHGANSYDFAHDKLREVAYAEVGAPQRRLLHRRAALALEATRAGDLDAVSGELASQYERAGMIEHAIPFYQRAAAVAQAVYANDEAISLLTRALDLLQSLPAGSRRDKQELDLLLSLAPIYRMTRGWTAPELERALDRSLALSETVGGDEQRAQALFGLQSVYVVQSRLDRVHVVYDEMEAVYQRLYDDGPPPFAGIMMVGARLHLGKIAETSAQLEGIIASRDPIEVLQIQKSQGANYAALAMGWQSHALWLLGYPQRALDGGVAAIKMAQDANQPFNQALAATYVALLQQLRAGEAVARAQAEQALSLSTTYQAPYYRNWANILATYAQALSRPDEEGIRRLRAALATFTASGAKLRLPYYLALLARLYLKAGRAAEALGCVERALDQGRAQNERVWDAELHRLRGEALLLSGADVGDAEAALLRAIEIARAQSARSFELRATTSLARLWGAQRRHDEARARLAGIYDWFTEGFETPDLRAAQRLLAAL